MRETARRAFVWGTYLVALAVVVQFLLAGLGVFYDSYFFFFHAVVNAPVIFFLPLLLVAAGFIGKVPRRLIWLSAAVAGLTVLQSILLVPYHIGSDAGAFRAIGGLHVVNALAIFWVTLQLLDGTRAWAAKPA